MRRQKYPIKTVRVDKLIRIGRYEKEERQARILDPNGFGIAATDESKEFLIRLP